MNFETEYTIISEEAKTAWIKINRTLDRNSINSPLIEEIDRVMGELESREFESVIFTGSGETFFSGGADALEMIRYDSAQATAFSEKIQALYNRIEASPVVSLAAINGLCYGGGMELALACDFRVAAETVRMGLPEVGVGIIPGGGGTQRLGELIGAGRALEMILTGRLCSAASALEIGLVHRVVPESHLIEESRKLLSLVFRNPRHAIIHAKKAVYARNIMDRKERYRNESAEFGMCFQQGFFLEEITRQVNSGKMPTTEKLPKKIQG